MCWCSKKYIKFYNGSNIDLHFFRFLGIMNSTDIHGREGIITYKCTSTPSNIKLTPKVPRPWRDTYERKKIYIKKVN